MSWAFQEPLVLLSLLFICLAVVAIVVALCWNGFRARRIPLPSFVQVFGYAVPCLVVASSNPTYRSYLMELYTANMRPHNVIHQASLLASVGAIVWLVYRAWQTFNIPVPRLMDVLRLDVPAPPELVLYDIKKTTVSIYWTRPPPNRLVEKYQILVNEVAVGETAGVETAATISGLIPGRFYNLRVVAIGHNNLQAPSEVLRMQTFRDDGMPDLGDRVPASLLLQRQLAAAEAGQQDIDKQNECGTDDNRVSGKDGESGPSAPSVEAALSPDRQKPASAFPTTSVTMIAGQRRGTVARKQPPPPPVVSMDTQQPPPPTSAAEPDMSLDQLNEKLINARMEKDNLAAQFSKEEQEYLEQKQALEDEIRHKKQLLKEKEEKSAKLRARARSSREESRAACRLRDKKRNELESTATDLKKDRDCIAKLENDITMMRRKRNLLATEMVEFEKITKDRLAQLTLENDALQTECGRLEAELAEKGKKLNALKDDHKTSTVALDEARWREEEMKLRKEAEERRRGLEDEIAIRTQRLRELDAQEQYLNSQFAILQQMVPQPIGGLVNDLEQTTGAMKRRARTGTTLSGTSATAPAVDGMYSYGGHINFGQGSFAEPGGLETVDTGVGSDPRNLREGAPLSPSARDLVPSNLWDDDASIDPPSPGGRSQMSVPGVIAPFHLASHSPVPSNRSASGMIPSPRGSTHNLPFYGFAADHPMVAPTSNPVQARRPGIANTNRFSNLFARKKASDKVGPAIGALKPTASRSFPREDEDEFATNRRRISISGHFLNRSSTGPDLGQPTSHPHSHSRAMSARRFNPFAGPGTGGLPLYNDRDPASPRPASIASDLTRPSTDSASFWAMPTGDTSSVKQSRFFGPDTMPWPTRAPSRRPSIHNTPPARTSLASPDDEILDDEALLDPQVSPSQVGVIGSRPPGQQRRGRLNPAAPTFMRGLFAKPSEKDQNGGSSDNGEGNGSSTRDKESSKKRNKSGVRSKGKESSIPGLETTALPFNPASGDYSPAYSTKSRDALSVYTDRSDSRESLALELESTDSNPPHPDALAVPPSKEPDNVVRKLFRKSSSGKFGSLSSRSGFFKKGPGSSVAGSERNGPSATTSQEPRSSTDAPDYDTLATGDEAAVFGRSLDSVKSNSHPLGSTKAAATKDGVAPLKESGANGSKITGWRFVMKKKNSNAKGDSKDSSDMDRAADTVDPAVE